MKLNNQTETLIVEAIKKGLKTDVDIARYARISSETLRRWKQLALGGDRRCEQLVAAMEQAFALRRAYLFMQMELSGKDDWRMWDRLLAISDPQNYGKEIKQEVTNKGDVVLRVVYGDRNNDQSAETA